MKTFSEFLNENLSYEVKSEVFDKILKDNEYKRMSKGGRKEPTKLFGNGKEVLFSYNEEKSKLIVLKQGWQLMNVKRGF